MKKITILLILCFMATSAKAQTFEEWFAQTKTQKKYLLQQIAALKVYSGYVKKGYEISKYGLKAIGDIKDFDLNLHSEYYNSLKNVNPSIKKISKVEDIITIHSAIQDVYEALDADLEKSEMFNREEVEYIHRVFSRLLIDCADLMDVLTAITTSDKFEMKDNERLERIDALHIDMQDKYTFANHFNSVTMAIATYRTQSEKDLQMSLFLNGFKTE